MRVTKALALDRLVTELQAAGVQVTSLGSHRIGGETEVYTYDVTGATIVELPETARPVIEAHDGRTEEELNPLNYSDKVPTRSQLKAGVDTIQEYLDTPSPTQAATVVAFKLICRALLFVMRRLGL